MAVALATGIGETWAVFTASYSGGLGGTLQLWDLSFLISNVRASARHFWLWVGVHRVIAAALTKVPAHLEQLPSQINSHLLSHRFSQLLSVFPSLFIHILRFPSTTPQGSRYQNHPHVLLIPQADPSLTSQPPHILRIFFWLIGVLRYVLTNDRSIWEARTRPDMSTSVGKGSWSEGFILHWFESLRWSDKEPWACLMELESVKGNRNCCSSESQT